MLNSRPLPALAAVVVCLAFFATVYLTLSTPGDIADHGDVQTDQRAVIGAAEFCRTGLGRLALTQVEDGGAEIGLRPIYYGQHPSGGVILLALCQKAGLTLRQCRAVPLLFTTMGLLAFFWFVVEATGRPWLAVLAVTAYASLSPIWLLADTYQSYSYGLFAKGVALWLTAAGTRRSGRPRAACFALGGVVGLAGVTFLSLETLPSIGISALLLPFALANAPVPGRLKAALHSTLWMAGGMIAGIAIHLANLLPTEPRGLAAILTDYLDSLSMRSFGFPAGNPLAHPYPLEIAHRLWMYTPQVFVAAAAGLLYLLARRVGGERVRWSHTRLVWTCLLSECLYFVFMLGHVRAHPHTTAYLCVTVALVVATSIVTVIESPPGGLPARVCAGLLMAVVAATSWFAPLSTEGSLIGRDRRPAARAQDAELVALARKMPADAVVVILPPELDPFAAEYALTREGLTVVRGLAVLPERPAALATQLPSLTSRPVFALAWRTATGPSVRQLAGRERHVADTESFSLFSLPKEPSLHPTSPE